MADERIDIYHDTAIYHTIHMFSLIKSTAKVN